jgi:hypothetical protein
MGKINRLYFLAEQGWGNKNRGKWVKVIIGFFGQMGGSG